MTTRVLLVDDLPDIQQRMRSALARPGQLEFVGEPTDGVTALASAARLQPDVVVVVATVPRLVGTPVLAALRESAPGATLVVLPTAPDHDGAADDGVGDGQQLRYLADLLLSPGHRRGPETVVHFEPTPECASAARDFARATLAEWCSFDDPCDQDSVDDVVLVVSELVSNAVRHVRRGCDLRLVLAAAVIRVECRDDGAGTPELMPRSTTRTFGRGLDLIDALTAAWGVEPAPGAGKVVWAEVPRRCAG